MGINVRLWQTERSGTLECDNGDKWVTVAISNSNYGSQCCGQRANVAYIDYLIPKSIIEEDIKRCLNLPPYTAIQYYNEDYSEYEDD